MLNRQYPSPLSGLERSLIIQLVSAFGLAEICAGLKIGFRRYADCRTLGQALLQSSQKLTHLALAGASTEGSRAGCFPSEEPTRGCGCACLEAFLVFLETDLLL